METLLQDLRYGFRMLLKNRAFAVVAVLTLGLGIGANTAIFSVVNAVLLRPLPYENSDRLVVLTRAPMLSNIKDSLTHTTFLDWRNNVDSFEQVTAYNADNNGVNLTGGAEPERVATREVSVNFFETLGVATHLGRAFVAEEAEPGKNSVAVMSYGLWQRQFGGDPQIIGQPLSLNGRSFTLIGIAPQGFDLPGNVELWIPISFGSDRILGRTIIPSIIGRLKEGVTVAQAQAEMDLLHARVKEQAPDLFPPGNIDRSIVVTPMLTDLVKNIGPALLILFGAVGFVLLIACANVANLLLARANARQKELAIRAAIGAGRFRLMKQLIVESLILALAGGAFGLLVSLWGVDLLLALSPDNLPRAKEIGIDGRVFGFVLATSLLTGMMFGLIPALKASKIDLNQSLKEGVSKSKSGFGGRSIGGVLVVSEIALALVLLIGAGLLIKSFVRLMRVDPGFSAENVLTVAISLPGTKYSTPAQKAEFYEKLIERLKALPAAQYVGAADVLPLGRSTLVSFPFTIEGAPPSSQDEPALLSSSVVSEDYFRAMGIRMMEGRYFTGQDDKRSTPVAIINRTMAERYWPNDNPIGKRLTLMGDKTPREIVGVVASTRWFGLDSAPILEAYVPHQQSSWGLSFLVMRTTSDPLALVGAVRSEVQSLDSDLPLYDVKTMEQRLSTSVAQNRFTLVLLATFAGVALTLAAVGVYGVIAYSVSQRIQEIGIRMALGARPADVMKLVIRQGMLLAVIGVGVGLAAAFGLTRVMGSLLYEVSATDPITFIIIPLILAGVALGACFVPARRAAKVDPMMALRHE